MSQLRREENEVTRRQFWWVSKQRVAELDYYLLISISVMVYEGGALGPHRAGLGGHDGDKCASRVAPLDYYLLISIPRLALC